MLQELSNNTKASFKQKKRQKFFYKSENLWISKWFIIPAAAATESSEKESSMLSRNTKKSLKSPKKIFYYFKFIAKKNLIYRKKI